MSVLCSIKNLNLTFGNKEIFKSANVVINHGEKIGLIGLNGKGKSSLFKLLNNELTPDTNPNFVFDKASDKLGPDRAFTTYLVTQKFHLPKDYCAVKDYFAFIEPELNKVKNDYDKALENADYDLQEKVMHQMDHIGFWDLANRFESYVKSFGIENLETDVRSLSGGEQRKILIALGLLSDANLILWDEPTNHLDIDSIQKLEEELLQSRKTLMIISHDRHLLSKVCDRIVHIQRGEILSYKGSYADYLETIKSQEELRIKSLSKLRNTLRREQDWMNQGIKARGTRSKKRVEGYENLKSKVGDLKSQARKKIEIGINDSGRKTKKLIEIENGKLQIEDHLLINSLNLRLAKGDKIGVLGENGVGKSTLMQALVNDKFLQASRIYRADGVTINYFDQKVEKLDMEKTPFQYLGDGEDFVHFQDGRSLHVNAYFEKFLFDKSEVQRPLSSFSGGELKRLQLALNLKNESDVWIFDEPTNDLDIESIEILEDALANFKGTVIIISHDRSFLENITNKIWYIHDKKIEKFEAGYSQVQDYLDLISIEKSYGEVEENSETTQVEEEPVTEKKKLTNKEKELIKKLPRLIKEKEKEIQGLEAQLAEIDYSNLDEVTSIELNKLTQNKEQAEEELLELYEKQEEFNA